MPDLANTGKWPKKLPPLTDEQLRIKDEFMQRWLELLPKKYGMIERFNHQYPVKVAQRKGRVLEIGCGLGGHIPYEDLSGNEYYALEMRPEIAARIGQRFPDVRVIVGDCQARLDFPGGFFDRVLAIHVLEHLPNLPETVREAHRLLKPDGQFSVVIPCEGGLAYTFARKISARRLFEKWYGSSYDWFIETEHVNVPSEIIEELERYFTVRTRSNFPM
ncbi:MAG: class I SAM-dependent methyltransferase, partial [Bryobacteraceae bacterium]